MFQYAAGKSLAIRLGTALKLETSLLRHSSNRPYLLKHYNIEEKFVSNREGYAVSGIPITFFQKLHNRVVEKFANYNQIQKILKSKMFQYQLSSYKEPHYHYDKNLMRLNDNVCIEGYWQSERYFIDISDTIKKEFTVKNRIEGKDRKILEMIESNNSVAIHFRRGDYIPLNGKEDYHGICDIDYYLRAVDYLINRVNNPHYFIFSDDCEWVKKKCSFLNPVTVVDHNEVEKCHEDMRLMAMCKHNIMANSTFSWWGSWLNPNHRKIVIAPMKWFVNKTNRLKDLIPEKWIRL